MEALVKVRPASSKVLARGATSDAVMIQRYSTPKPQSMTTSRTMRRRIAFHGNFSIQLSSELLQQRLSFFCLLLYSSFPFFNPTASLRNHDRQLSSKTVPLFFLTPGRYSASATTHEVNTTTIETEIGVLWVYGGCWIDNIGGIQPQGTVPARNAPSTTEIGNMANKVCAEFCIPYPYFFNRTL